ncbi:RagB/SusD family nutrient uptake outer membrane protein, partial [Phocaeicola plebeius]|uniref:RagB/SusD family nutrient uptake outer membrane protein n=1 Tax=Phocaeicola plebeius TaxID=310297 RepID=UPI000E4EA0DE
WYIRSLPAAYPNVSGDNAKLIREIRRERRIEMFAEGVRYDDIRRWKCGNLLTAPRLGIIIEGAGYSEKDIAALKETVGVNEDGALTIYEKRYVGQRPTPIFEDPKHYLSPIPTDEIGKAPNIKQNPGW